MPSNFYFQHKMNKNLIIQQRHNNHTFLDGCSTILPLQPWPCFFTRTHSLINSLHDASLQTVMAPTDHSNARRDYKSSFPACSLRTEKVSFIRHQKRKHPLAKRGAGTRDSSAITQRVALNGVRGFRVLSQLTAFAVAQRRPPVVKHWKRGNTKRERKAFIHPTPQRTRYNCMHRLSFVSLLLMPSVPCLALNSESRFILSQLLKRAEASFQPSLLQNCKVL